MVGQEASALLWAVPIVSAVVSAMASIAVTLFVSRREWTRLNREFALDLSIEGAIQRMLALNHLPYRSFTMIRHHIGGFDANELRRHLVRAGAVRFMAADGTELWAMRERVEDDYRQSRWKHPEAPRNKVLERDLFPGAFEDNSNH